MNKILIAGSTGYLGQHIVEELQQRGANFVALARNKGKLTNKGIAADMIIEAEVTLPETLKGQFDGVDTIISTVGITRQKDGLTYMDVDYQANSNLLQEAKRAGVKKFIYISSINGQQMRHLKIMEAKEKFVDELKQSGLSYTIVRPNGFFSDMKDFLDMAKGGRVYLFGHGDFKLNPIHGADLAKAIVESIDDDIKELVVGGPDILTQNEIGELALSALQKPKKISHLPDWIRRAIIRVLHAFTSSKTYGPIEFFMTMMAQDNVAPRYGVHRLEQFFRTEVDSINEISES